MNGPYRFFNHHVRQSAIRPAFNSGISERKKGAAQCEEGGKPVKGDDGADAKRRPPEFQTIALPFFARFNGFFGRLGLDLFNLTGLNDKI